MSYRLAIFENLDAWLEPVRLALLAPSSQPEDVKGTNEEGYRLTRVIDLPVPADDLPGSLPLDELLSAPRAAARLVRAFGLVAKLPRHDDARLDDQHARQTAEEMRDALDDAYLDRAEMDEGD